MNSDADILRHYFPGLSETQFNRFERLLPLYREWNEQINVISRKDIDQLYERHVLHSLGIAKVVTFADGSTVLDAGTGGGFPGIPLAIYFPGVQFYLVDSIGKKVKVVNEIVNALQLENVSAMQGRVEEVKQQFDFTVSRAVAPLAEMVRWLKPLVRKGQSSSLPNGMLFLKGGILADEIKASGREVRIFELKNFFSEDFFSEKKVLYLPGQ